MTRLEFEAWVLTDWARLYKLAKARQFTPLEATKCKTSSI